MNRILLSVFLVAVFSTLYAQTGKPAATKPATALKNFKDSSSYAIGVSVANFYKQQGISSVNSSLIAKAIDDILAGKKALLDDAAANTVMNKCITGLQEQKAKARITEGNNFLAKNKTKPGIKTTASGLQYEVITEGTGARPTAADTVICHYRGTYINGTGFDNSYDKGQPITYPVANFIAGWTEGLQLMTVGSKYKFYISYTLGYGPNDYNGIPGGSMLIFELELLDIKKRQ